jgi:hypothetical protein
MPNDWYKSESVDVVISIDHTESERENKHKKELQKLIEYYINNVRTASYDWYLSLEPLCFDDVEWDDYCVLWSILQKEWIMDEIEQTFEWCEFIGI